MVIDTSGGGRRQPASEFDDGDGQRWPLVFDGGDGRLMWQQWKWWRWWRCLMVVAVFDGVWWHL